MPLLLREFRSAVEARAVDAFWVSRGNGKLLRAPERIAQALFAMFAKGFLGQRGLVLREIASGTGFVDVAISFGSHALHLVELKILKGQFTGASQLGSYMRNEGRQEGWLLLIDVRKQGRRRAIPAEVEVRGGRVRTVVVEANPVAPHDA